MSIATPATDHRLKIYHFDGEREMAVALEALLSPELHGLEVQLAPITYQGKDGKLRSHSFDLRITFRDGFKRAVFVRNGSSLARSEVQDEINAIFAATSQSFADDKIVINGDHYTRAYRDNLRRLWHLSKYPDPETDTHVEQCALNTSYWHMRDLIEQSGLEAGDAFQSIMRLIGKGVLNANLHTVLCPYTRVWLS